ncbi:hypothetical protein AB0N28_08225 [Streptomyces sp. NPDC051130]|uniref:hypothetical protein n=1 Tax=Streptomyces sp. NPDC051130 TaxID=3157223 RepID=UPI00341F0A2E
MAEDERGLWLSVYSTAGGWQADQVFADRTSAAAPAIAVDEGKLYCAHRGARQQDGRYLPLRVTTYAPELLDVLRGEVTEDRLLGEAVETPALTVYRGGLLCAHTLAEPSGRTRIAVTPLGGEEPSAPALEDAIAPALVSYGDALHLFAVAPLYGKIIHRVAPTARGPWEKPAGGDTAYGMLRVWNKTGPYPANLSAAVHDGSIHLVYRFGSDDARLMHAVYDGGTWHKPAPLGEGHTSRRGAAVASYDGRLHAVYPSSRADRLRHAVFDGRTWDEGTDLDEHDSRNTPALAPVHDAVTGTYTLLLVHRSA